MTARAPSGAPPPSVVEIDGQRVDLLPLAEETCRRYYLEFPDEHGRYGPAGVQWCLHDNRWLLSWAIDDVRGVVDLEEQAGWLARVLHARDFPVNRLVRDLQLAAEVVQSAIGAHGPAVARRFVQAAVAVEKLELR